VDVAYSTELAVPLVTLQNSSLTTIVRVADLETVYDSANGVFNNLFATATALFYTKDDGSGQPPLKLPLRNSFVVKDIFTELQAARLRYKFL